MTTAFDSTNTAIPLQNMAFPVLDSIDRRSELIAKISARKNEMPQDVVRQLLSPHASRLPASQSDALLPLFGELVQAASTNEPGESGIPEEREQAISTGLAVSMRWIFEMEQHLGTPLALRVMLKSLMPLYLAAGQGRVGTSFVDTFSLIRVTCMITELNRLTHENELALWLTENGRSNTDPLESIPQSFRVSLPKMSNVFWKEIAAKTNSGSAQPKKLVDSTSIAETKHKAWWSLAGQLCTQRAQITIPADLAIGVIAWEKLLDHWQRVTKTLASAQEVRSKTSNGRDEDTPHVRNPFTPIKRGEPSEKNPKASAAPIFANEKDPKLADDHRFVEIRSARDPQLSANLDQLLQQSRNDQGTLSLMVVKKLGGEAAASSHALQNWQSSFIEAMDTHSEAANVRGFVSDEGELTLVFQDVDRAELAQWIRESFANLNTASADASIATASAQPLVSGVAMVNAPSRSFRIDQLISAAWRCLEGASTQGSGAVKTIEVY